MPRRRWRRWGRNNFDGPGLFNLDLSLFRKFDITKRIMGEFRFQS